MFEISDEYLAAMNAVAIGILKSEATFNEITSLGIDGSNWPDCEPKFILDHMNDSMKYGFSGAKAAVLAKHGSYISLINQSAPKYIDPEKVNTELVKENKLFWAKKFQEAIDDAPLELDQAINAYLSKTNPVSKVYNLRDRIPSLVAENERKLKLGESKVVIPTFPLLSNLVQGFNPKSITQINAMTGIGKTNLMVSLAQSASEIMDVLFINMEMDEHDFGPRFIHNATGVDNKSWRDGSYLTEYNANKITEYTKAKEAQHSIWYTDGSALTTRQIESLIYSKFTSKKKGIVFIDYDTKVILPGRKEEWAEVLELYVKMEAIAKRCNVHIVIASQGNEDGKSKASKRAEQPCSNVLNFYREKSGINNSLDRYFVRPIKTRYNSFQTLEMEADLSRSKVTEKGFVKAEEVQEKKSQWF